MVVKLFALIGFHLVNDFKYLHSCSMKMTIHKVCRNNCYFKSSSCSIYRFSVPDDKVPWSVEYTNYNPLTFNIENLSSQPWADPEIDDPEFSPQWNKLDGKVNRQSYTGKYEIKNGYPQNPCGRTGLKGRGRLGRWGPNHAADPIVTRWKRDVNGMIIHHSVSSLPILEMVAIKRHDCGMWAIPGGMIDPGEIVTNTLKREFCEEAMNSLSLSTQEKHNLETLVSKFFEQGEIVYKGYVDDPRNTDNAWMETIATNFHDNDGSVVGKFPLEAGDDACQVKWMEINLKLDLYANHVDFLKQVAQMKNAHL